MSGIQIQKAGPEDALVVMDLVSLLLRELGEEGDETGDLDFSEMKTGWQANAKNHMAFLARTEDGTAVGVATLATAFALYANGCYGIINEMYVAPEYRSTGVGALLIEAVTAHGREQGWQRLDVTAPESERWERTRRFYEGLGFKFTGPKLKLLLS